MASALFKIGVMLLPLLPVLLRVAIMVVVVVVVVVVAVVVVVIVVCDGGRKDSAWSRKG